MIYYALLLAGAVIGFFDSMEKCELALRDKIAEIQVAPEQLKCVPRVVR